LEPEPFDKLGFYHCDHLGTPQEITDEEGNIAWQAQYKAWGEAKEIISKAAQGARFRNPLRFQGQYFDHETGLHYNRFRYYDPETGRFISKDPIGFRGGLIFPIKQVKNFRIIETYYSVKINIQMNFLNHLGHIIERCVRFSRIFLTPLSRRPGFLCCFHHDRAYQSFWTALRNISRLSSHHLISHLCTPLKSLFAFSRFVRSASFA
jgi:RHS repeat-associated protein